jgi:hypothetical protein
VPNAKVAVTLVARGALQTTTGTGGQYTIPFLAPGTYGLEAEAAGFKHYVRDGIEVSAGDGVGIDIRLE